jgi:hypothetical protein
MVCVAGMRPRRRHIAIIVADEPKLCQSSLDAGRICEPNRSRSDLSKRIGTRTLHQVRHPWFLRKATQVRLWHGWLTGISRGFLVH